MLRCGLRPVGMVIGNCVDHVAHQKMRQTMKMVGQNMEMPLFTPALYEARELAMERMQSEAKDLGGRGIVGAGVSEGSFGWGFHVIEFFALGTAVVPLEDKDVGGPTMVLPL
ncbi:MAG TPA: heavy metal-binding domain-containing protein [Solirubrobacteraceae bacterium]|nr:heavy metal-binding domain-containing protein [Solirubrobacteraceae bacterium]